MVCQQLPNPRETERFAEEGRSDNRKGIGLIFHKFAGLFQELRKGGTKNRAIQAHITPVPGEAPLTKGGYVRWRTTE